MQKTADNLAYCLARAHRRFTSRLSTELKPLGLTVDMWSVLGALSEIPGLAMTQIAEHLSHNLPTVTKLIDRMVSDNLVYRKPHHSDRRRVLIFPTERGLELYHEAASIADELEARLLGSSKISGAELQALLQRLADQELLS